MDLKDIIDDFKLVGERLSLFNIRLVTLDGPRKKYDGDDYFEYTWAETYKFCWCISLDDLIGKCLANNLDTVYARPTYITSEDLMSGIYNNFEACLQSNFYDELDLLCRAYPQIYADDYYYLLEKAESDLKTCRENYLQKLKPLEGDFVGYTFEVDVLDKCFVFDNDIGFRIFNLFADYNDACVDICDDMIERLDAAAFHMKTIC